MRLRLSVLLLLMLPGSFSIAQLSTYRTELDLGVKAYRLARYEEAISHFKQAVAAAPEQPTAHHYLATAYAEQYIPGVDTPENAAYAESAIVEFDKVVNLNPPRETQLAATKGVASLYFSMKKLDLAREAHLKVTELDAQDAEAYYAIGVIDWTESYTLRMETRAKLGLKPEASLIANESCWDIRSANENRVQDGIEMLTKALSLGPDYDDAMAYMNLMYRERADIQCGNTQAYRTDSDTADKWVDLTMATKKQKAEGTRLNPQQQ